jgi:uncharacterized protein YjbI with pentapeptide repeats
MANPEHVRILYSGVEAWNNWRKQNPEEKPDLSGADLRSCPSIRWCKIGVTYGWPELADFSEVDLSGADLRRADLSYSLLHRASLRGTCLRESNLISANFIEADMERCDLLGADLTGADLENGNLNGAQLRNASLGHANLSGASFVKAILIDAHLIWTNLVGANLTNADLEQARILEADFSRALMKQVDLRRADIRGSILAGALLTEANMAGARLDDVDLRDADLRGAILIGSSLTKTNLNNANISECRIYGVSAWDLKTEGTIQKDLLISDFREPDILVDNIEVGQFIHLLLENQKIRHVIDTITTKVVLILGRFGERKEILDCLRSALRKRDWVPVVFDFGKPQNRDFMGTVSTLAHLSRFVLADITDATSVREELRTIIVSHLSNLPVQPLLESSSSEYYNFPDYKNCSWVLKITRYRNLENLMEMLPQIITVAEAKARELTARLNETPQTSPNGHLDTAASSNVE